MPFPSGVAIGLTGGYLTFCLMPAAIAEFFATYVFGMTWLIIVAQLPLFVAQAQGILTSVAFDLTKEGSPPS